MIPAPIMITGLTLQRISEFFKSLNFVKAAYIYFVPQQKIENKKY